MPPSKLSPRMPAPRHLTTPRLASPRYTTPHTTKYYYTLLYLLAPHYHSNFIPFPLIKPVSFLAFTFKLLSTFISLPSKSPSALVEPASPSSTRLHYKLYTHVVTAHMVDNHRERNRDLRPYKTSVALHSSSLYHVTAGLLSEDSFHTGFL